MTLPVTGIANRRYDIFDANLELRAAAAAAIVTVAGDYKNPDYESALKDLGPGEVLAKAVIRNLAMTLNGDNTSYAHIAIVGVNEAEASQAELAALRVGCKEVLLDTADIEDDQILELLFSNVKNGVLYPKVKLVVVTGGTSISLDFTSYITRVA